MEAKAQQTILIVEDDPVVREVLGLNLTGEGYRVLTAADGLEGVEMAQNTLPGVILMDMRLPRLSGWGATRRLKEMPLTSGIPIIALTAQSAAEDLQRCFDAGCDAFMSKPIQFSQLFTKVEMLLRKAVEVVD